VVSIRDAIRLFPQVFEEAVYSKRELTDANSKAEKDRIIEFCLLSIEAYNATNAEVLSVLNVETFVPGDDKHVMSGFSKLLTSMSRGVDVRLRHVVSKIEYNPNPSKVSKKNVVVTTDKGIFTAAYCCVTLPLGILKEGKVTFSPPLPKKKREAIDRIGYGLLDKVILQFEHPITLWDKDTEYVGILPYEFGDKHGTFMRHTFGWMHNLDSLFPGSAIYVWYVSGEFAEHLESITNDDVAKLAVELLEKTRKSLQKKDGRKTKIKALPALKKCRVTRWKMDQFSLGSYCYVHTNTLPGDFEVLGEPVGDCLTFAGEAASLKDFGMVNCTYETGTKAGVKLSQWLKSSKSKL